MPPAEHAAAGSARAARVRPLDEAGRASNDGQIVLLSLGMSNTTSEFGRFVQGARANGAINGRLRILNGALSGADTAMWADAASPAWNHVRSTLRGNGSAAQVQIIWMKHAHLRTTAFPGEVSTFADHLDAILRNARSAFPNLQIVYVSSRTRAGAVTRRGPGEPQAYETAFAVRQFIERQMAASSGPGPWVSWGPYLWATGRPRSDGLAWSCADLEPDRLHPSNSGDRKVADQLMAFFMTDPSAAPWFLEPGRGGGGPVIRHVRASKLEGRAPLEIEFEAEAPGAVAYYWSFADGTTSTSSRPRKVFHVPGQYEVRLTITDNGGRWTRSAVTVEVLPGAGGAATPVARPPYGAEP